MKRLKNKIWPILTFLLFGFLYLHFAKEMIQRRIDGLYVGHINLFGDLVYHLTLINKFLETKKIFIDNPIYASPKPDYPIAVDYITALIARISTVEFAIFITTLTLGLLGVYAARKFILTFIKNEKVAFFALLIFFFNGGFGFYYFFRDFIASKQTLALFLLNMPTEYTELKEQGFWWINNFLAYFLPQRAFLFAFPITLFILLLLYKGWEKRSTILFVSAGVIAGLLPLVQIHSLLVIFFLSCFYFFYTIRQKNKWDFKIIKSWLIFGLITIVIAIPTFKSLTSVSEPANFIRFHFGWMSQENIFWFWFKNLGIFAPVLVSTIFWLYKKNNYLFKLYLPFLFIFFLSNTVAFQPWEFDNSKFLIYWYFASSIIVAYFVVEEFLNQKSYFKLIGIALVAVMVFSASLDIFRTFTKISAYQIFSTKDIEVANTIKETTAKDAIFITAPIHNHPITALAGRSTLLGFTGWVWSHGLNYSQREQDISKIYAGDDADKLIRKYRVNYVTYGPEEKNTFAFNQIYFEKFQKIDLGDGWEFYDVSNLWSNGNR